MPLLDRLGRLLRFDPVGRPLRVWVRSRPGEEDAEVVAGRILRLADQEALVALERDVELGGRCVRQAWVRPVERRYGFGALWFSFICVDASPERDAPAAARWWLRLGAPTSEGLRIAACDK